MDKSILIEKTDSREETRSHGRVLWFRKWLRMIRSPKWWHGKMVFTVRISIPGENVVESQAFPLVDDAPLAVIEFTRPVSAPSALFTKVGRKISGTLSIAERE